MNKYQGLVLWSYLQCMVGE